MFDKPRLHKMVPASVDYEKLLPYFLYRPKNVIRKTLGNNNQLAKAVIKNTAKTSFEE